MSLETLDSFDVAVAQFVEQMWEEGEPKTNCQDLLAALQYYIPSLRRNLALQTRNAHTGDANDPRNSCSFLRGPRGGRAPLAGFAVRVQLLQPSPNGRTSFAGAATCGFRQNVGRCRFRVDEARPEAGRGRRFDGRRPSDTSLPLETLRNFGTRERSLRSVWAHVTRCLELDGMACRPCSLRRGGATHLYRLTGNPHIVAQVGRWSSLTTTRRYISDATASLTSIRLTERLLGEYRALAAELRQFLHHST